MDNKNIPREGDRVAVIRDYCNARKGMTGTVKRYDPIGRSCAVEFDKPFVGAHDCEGFCSSMRGQMVHISCLRGIDPVSGFKFVIIYDGDKTTARLYIDKKLEGKAELYHIEGCEYSVEEIVTAATKAALDDKKCNEANAIDIGDLVEVTEGIHGTPIPRGARGHAMARYNADSWMIDFHECYGVTPWEIPESKIRKINPYETNMKRHIDKKERGI